MTSTVERLAGWAAELTVADVPPAVLERCRDQRRSVLASMAASSGDQAARRVTRALPDDPAYAAAAEAIALDFDDYVCFAHTGHSAVLVPLFQAQETGSSGAEQLLAQVIANEVEARLGGACLIGPLNGQLWSFVHAAGAALAAGRLLGLDAGRLAHALAISLWQAPRPTVPGFMAPDTKLLTAAEPLAMGIRAARLAAGGVTGPLDLLDHPHGFLHAFAFAPLPGLLGGLGDGWATTTMSIKPYPGCAYIDTTVDALLDLDLPPAGEIAAVDVDASLLTCGMDAMSREYGAVDAGPPSPVTVTFSIPWNVAIVLVAGRLTPDEVDAGWLEKHHHELAPLARRVTLRHDWSLTARSAEAFGHVLPATALVSDAGTRSLLRGVRQARTEHPGLGLGVADLLSLTRLRPSAFGSLGRGKSFWDQTELDRFRMTFPARVRVRTRDGRELVAEATVPRGGAGHPTVGPGEVAREKLAAWGPRRWGDDGVAALDAGITGDAGDLGAQTASTVRSRLA